MKRRELWMAVAAGMIGLGLAPSLGWATRAVGNIVTGPVTSTPTSTQIEVAHVAYKIRADSPAAKDYGQFYTGQVVDLIFDSAPGDAAPQVTSIQRHAGT